MEDLITVTVMITYYNQKEFIIDSLSSVVNQKTSFNYEIICGDDGSSDGTYEELLEWERQYPNKIRVMQMDRDPAVKYEPIVRVSQNRLNMLKCSRGVYVVFLDGDDYFIDENRLQKQVDLLEKHPKATCCGGPCVKTWNDDKHKEMFEGFIGPKEKVIRRTVYWSFYWIHAEAFMFRNAIKSDDKIINRMFFDDNLITAYYLRLGDIVYTPDCMVAYRQVDGSSWNDRDELKQAFVNLAVYNEAKRILPNMRFANHLKFLRPLRVVFDNRMNEINIDAENSVLAACLKNERFIEDTVRYKDMNSGSKVLYILRYSNILFMKYIRKALWLVCRLPLG